MRLHHLDYLALSVSQEIPTTPASIRCTSVMIVLSFSVRRRLSGLLLHLRLNYVVDRKWIPVRE